jgi:hypothetical protein
MNLYPDSKKWVLNELINPNINQVTEKLDFLNKIIPSYNDNLFKDYSYVKLLEGFNKFLPVPNLDYERSESEDWYKEVKSIIQAGVVFFKGNLMFNLKASCYDVCAILLICKKLKEEKITYLEYPEIFIKNILVELNDSFLSNNDYLHYPYLVDFFSYNTVLDDKYMEEYCVLSHLDNAYYEENNISLSLFLNGGYYSYLFYNEEFKSMTYRSAQEEEITQLDDYIINNVDFKKDLFKYNANALSYRNEWITDRDTVILAVKNDGSALQFASDDLKSDREVVLAAVKNDGSALQFASDDLRSAREVVLAAVKNNGYALEYASYDLTSDREVVLVAINKNSMALQFTDDDLKNDRNFIMKAIKELDMGYILFNAGETLKSDREVLLVAIKSYQGAFHFASEHLKTDINFIRRCILANHGVYDVIPEYFKEDKIIKIIYWFKKIFS